MHFDVLSEGWPRWFNVIYLKTFFFRKVHSALNYVHLIALIKHFFRVIFHKIVVFVVCFSLTMWWRQDKQTAS